MIMSTKKRLESGLIYYLCCFSMKTNLPSDIVCWIIIPIPNRVKYEAIFFSPRKNKMPAIKIDNNP